MTFLLAVDLLHLWYLLLMHAFHHPQMETKHQRQQQLQQQSYSSRHISQLAAVTMIKTQSSSNPQIAIGRAEKGQQQVKVNTVGQLKVKVDSQSPAFFGASARTWPVEAVVVVVGEADAGGQVLAHAYGSGRGQHNLDHGLRGSCRHHACDVTRGQ
jgi:hypothetical protein